jgi:hypothetical protein
MTHAWEARRDIPVLMPSKGWVLAGAVAGSIATPVVSLTGATAGALALPLGNIIIPKGMLVPGRSMIAISGLVTRVGANATASLNIRLGRNNSTTDNVVSTVSLAATTNLHRRFQDEVYVGSKTGYTTLGVLAIPGSTASAASDKTTHFDTNEDNYVSLDISAANASDAFHLIGLQVRIL